MRQFGHIFNWDTVIQILRGNRVHSSPLESLSNALYLVICRKEIIDNEGLAMVMEYKIVVAYDGTVKSL